MVPIVSKQRRSLLQQRDHDPRGLRGLRGERSCSMPKTFRVALRSRQYEDAGQGNVGFRRVLSAAR